MREPVEVGRPGTKLEGLAVVGEEVWLAYDGDQAAIERRKRVEFVPMVGPQKDSEHREE